MTLLPMHLQITCWN